MYKLWTAGVYATRTLLATTLVGRNIRKVDPSKPHSALATRDNPPEEVETILYLDLLTQEVREEDESLIQQFTQDLHKSSDRYILVTQEPGMGFVPLKAEQRERLRKLTRLVSWAQRYCSEHLIFLSGGRHITTTQFPVSLLRAGNTTSRTER